MDFRISLILLVCFVSTSTASNDRKTYIIHMDKEKITTSDYYQGNAKTWFELVMDSITKFSSVEDDDGVIFIPELLYVYETSIFGFAAKLSIKQVQTLDKIHGVLSVSPDEILILHTTHSPQFLGLQHGRGLWNASNLAADVIIGVLDSGIWPEHISFRDTDIPSLPSRWKGVCEAGTNFSTSSCNRKLIGARAFFKGYEASAGKINETVDFRSARDSQGHGTHTASTAAGDVVDNASLFGMAEGSATGMRYTSRIAAYKVCWPSGCANSDILAAIDRAIADGVDVLSLSLGGNPRPYYTDSIAIASFGAIEKGVFVSCSAGNSGPSRSTVANVAPWIMTVAASYTDRSFPTMVRLGNGRVFKGSSLYHGKKTKQLPIVYGKTAGRQGAQFCIKGSLNKTMVKGKIVVCERGLNSRTAKGEQVKLAGGFGMITINRDGEGEELFADAHVLPATTLGAAAGKAVKSYVLSTKKPTASLYFKGTVYGNQAPMVAGFSSRGPSVVGPDVIKPDITAPGVNILAAWPPIASPSLLKTDKRRVLFNIISGTSMSCPHVSGIAALIKSAHKNWSPAAIKSALMTTAYTLDNKGGPIKDVSSITSKFATPFAFGSGHVDPERAADPGLVYDISTQDYLNYMCSLNYTSSQIALFSRKNFTCSKHSVLQPGDLNYPSFAVLFNKTAQISRLTYKRTLTNVGFSTSTYVVQVQEFIGVSVTVRPEKLSFRNLGEKLSYKVTFSASERKDNDTISSFGSLTWVCGKYRVRSPIAVTWQ